MEKQDSLNVEQEAAVQFYKGCCNVVASAGSGKTTVIVRRVERLIREYGVAPEKILVVTFSRKARDELHGRLMVRMSGIVTDVNVSTFHSLGNQIVCWKYGRKYRVLSHEQEQIKIIDGILSDYESKWGDKCDAAYYLQHISLAKNRMELSNSNTQDGAIYFAYERRKRVGNLLDFDDLIVQAVKVLQDDEDARKTWQDKYEFVLVDEMQDVSMAQYELLRLLCGKNKNLFTVGDPLQNIYQWRGSDNRFMLDFKKDWPDAIVMHLRTNYRSSRNIVQAANQFAGCLEESKSEFYMESVPDKPPFQDAEYHIYGTPEEEAESVKDKILELVDNGCSYGDITILARTNEYLQSVKTVLAEINIPYSTKRDISIFLTPEVGLILSYLRLITNRADNDAFEYAYCRPVRNLGKGFLKAVKEISVEKNIPFYEAMDDAAMSHPKFPSSVEKLRTVIEGCGIKCYDNVKATIRDLRKIVPIEQFVSNGMPDSKNVSNNLDSLECIASDYTDIGKFLDDVSCLVKDRRTAKNAVQLLTIHKAKGLEFPVVFVIGLNRELFPSENCSDINEERRLMYVAMTRAEKVLYVSSADGNADDGVEYDFIPAIMERMTKNAESISSECEVCVGKQSYGDFAWTVYDTAKILMPELKPATLARLMLLVTYMDYDNVLVHDNGVRLNLDDIRGILRVSDRMMYNIINELKSVGIVNFKDIITVNPVVFYRGTQNRTEQSMLYRDGKMIARLYRDGVRALYNSAKNGSAKKLSYIFRIMPFVNREYNIVCHNPLEKDLNKIQPIPLGELAEIIGYGRSNASKLQSLLLDPVFETDSGETRAVHYVSGDELGIENHCLFINPKVYYGGNRHNEVSILGRFR